MAALRCLHVWLYNVMIFFNWGFWGFVLSFSSVLPLEQAFQEAQRSRERFSPGNQEAIGCLGTHTAVLGQTPSPSSCLKGPAWGCSLCMLLREPPVPCELLEERMVHARGAVATMRHGAEGREASHTPAKQSGGWASTLGQMGQKEVGNPSAKVTASSRQRILAAGHCPSEIRLRDHGLVLQLGNMSRRAPTPLTCMPVETPVALQPPNGQEAVVSLQQGVCK